jgi:hypothetical protein
VSGCSTTAALGVLILGAIDENAKLWTNLATRMASFPVRSSGFLLSQVLWQRDGRAYTGPQRKLMLDQRGARRDIAAVVRPSR